MVDKNNIKVLFVNPPSMPYYLIEKFLAGEPVQFNQVLAMPMAFLYLGAVLERDLPGVDVKLVDLAKAVRDHTRTDDPTPIGVADLIERTMRAEVPDDFVPDFIGITILFSTANRSTIAVAEILKRRWPSVPIIVGGMHATNSTPELLSVPAIDYVCRGEGESIIVPFAQAIAAGESPETLTGVFGRGKLTGQNKPTELARWIDDLDRIPFPAWHLLTLEDYILPSGRTRRLDTMSLDGEATIVTTRGCPFSCTFCSSSTVHGRKMRYRSVENVIEEIRILYHRFGVRVFVPEDDLFTVKKDRIIAMCHAVADEFPGIKFQFPNGLSVATLDEDVIRALKRIGMQIASIAIESGSAHTQRHIIKKNCDLDRARDVVQICRDMGIVVRTNFVLGFPGETRAMIEESVAYARSIATDWSLFFVAAPLVGSEMFRQFSDLGHIDGTFNWDNSFYHERHFDTAEISAVDLKNICYRANIENNFFQNYNFRTGNHEQAMTLYQDIHRSYPNHLAALYCIGLCHRAMGRTADYTAAMAACDKLLAEAEPDSLPRRIYDTCPEYFTELTPPADGAAPHLSVPPPPRGTAAL